MFKELNNLNIPIDKIDWLNLQMIIELADFKSGNLIIGVDIRPGSNDLDLVLYNVNEIRDRVSYPVKSFDGFMEVVTEEGLTKEVFEHRRIELTY